MLDIRLFREGPERVKENLKRRADSNLLKLADQVIRLDAEWRKKKGELDRLRASRNEISKKIDEAKHAGKPVNKLLGQAKELPAQTKALEASAQKAEAETRESLLQIPNLLDDSVPAGKDDSSNQEIRKWGAPTKPAFSQQPHGVFLEQQGLADFQRAARASGAGFFYLINSLAELDFALQKFALDFLSRKGFIQVEVPHLLSREAYEGVVGLEDFEHVMYKIEGEPLYLIATSEHSLCALFRGEIFEERELPLKLAGVSPCYRREIGAHGVDSRGLFRVHQFNKVEQFVFCRPEDSKSLHEELLANAETLSRELGLPYRVVNICTGDIGSVAAKKYDIETWMPRENAYRETASCSNCTAYQAVRSNIRFRRKGNVKEKEWVHTLNSTALATSRVIRALVENYQQKDGTIKLPRVLHPYLNGRKEIHPNPSWKKS